MWGNIKRIALVLTVATAGLFFSGCESTTSSSSGIIGSYDLRFGILLPSASGAPEVVSEVSEVERIVDNGYAHGFTVRRKGGGRFMLSYAIRFPEPLSEEEQGLATTGTFSEGGRVYTSQPNMVWDVGYQVFFFSETDPLGIYELEVFIDGELYQTISYNVIKPRF